MPDEETYRKLQQYLDKQPCGFPATDTGSDIETLMWMFTPEQAEVALHMRTAPESAEAIAKRCGKPEPEVAEILEGMVRDGLILPVRDGARSLFMAMQYMVGFGENQQSHRLNPERAQLLVKYTEESGFIDDFTRQKQMRVVPVGETVDVPRASIARYDNVRDVINSHDVISASPCCCRVIRKNIGEGCDRPAENELAFGYLAQYRIDNGFGRKVSREEALAIIDEADEQAMVLSPVNAKEDIGMCICCGCCCFWLEGVKRTGRPADYVQSSFQAEVDADRCNECGTCVDRCQMDAVSENGGSVEVDLGRCIGCGLCVTRCDSGAMSLVSRPGAGEPPGTYLSGLAGIAGSRGYPMGKLRRFLEHTSVESLVKQWTFLEKAHLARPIADFMAKRGLL